MTDQKQRLSDEEIIATFMEPRPSVTLREWRSKHPEDWRGNRHYPLWWQQPRDEESTLWVLNELMAQSLNVLRSVEARLTEEQRRHYTGHVASLNGLVGAFYEDAWVFLHATPEQKTKSLAEVLRPVVEKK